MASMYTVLSVVLSIHIWIMIVSVVLSLVVFFLGMYVRRSVVRGLILLAGILATIACGMYVFQLVLFPGVYVAIYTVLWGFFAGVDFWQYKRLR